MVRSTTPEMVKEFLDAVVDRARGSVIGVELRVGGAKRSWGKRFSYHGSAALLADLPSLAALAERKDACTHFKVLCRTSHNGITLPGRAAWADLSFSDYGGGEVDCRRVLDAYPIPPSVVVHSGHGLQLYWLLHQPFHPQALYRLSGGLTEALGGVNARGPACLMRLPGTLNREEFMAPVPVEIELLDTSRRYDPAEFEEHVTLWV